MPLSFQLGRRALECSEADAQAMEAHETAVLTRLGFANPYEG